MVWCFFTHTCIHALWLQPSEKAMSTHIHHKGLLLRSRGKPRQEVIMGTDSGGQCQASFRIHSLRSSCYIFYWRNKRWRAIFKREQFSKERHLKRQEGNRRVCRENKTRLCLLTATINKQLSAHCSGQLRTLSL